MKYKKITKKELKEILKKHKLWLEDNPEGAKADLSEVDLNNVDFHCMDLRYADLRHTNLFGANLCHADLTGAILYGADLSNADLGGAILSNAELSDADLTHANLNSAYLTSANLSRANLSFTDLTDASLEHSTLCYTNLSGAIGDLLEFRKGKILTEPMVGYKKCRDGVTVVLEIPEGATVFSINGKKCRTNKAKVIAVEGADVGISVFNKSVSYYPGKTITISDFNCEYNIECSTGIHFFADRKLVERFELF